MPKDSKKGGSGVSMQELGTLLNTVMGGSNARGSAITGGDGRTDLSALERARREANNQTFSKNNGQYVGMRKANKTSKVATPKPVEESVEERLPSTIYVVTHTVNIAGDTTKLYVDYSSSKATIRLYASTRCVPVASDAANEIDIVEIEPLHRIDNVVSENYGWYKTDPKKEKGRHVITSAPFQEEVLRSIRIDGLWTDRRHGLVFLPLLIKLRGEFRSARGVGPISSSLADALKNVTSLAKNTCDGALPQPIRTWFHDVCDFTEAVYRLQVMEAHASSNVCNNMFLPGAIAARSTMVIRTDRVNRVNTVDVPQSKLDEQYDIKHGIKVKKGPKTFPLTAEWWFQKKPWPVVHTAPSFDMPAPGRATHKWVTLTDTVRYSNSAANLYGAMSRIIKQRDGEVNYQTNQSHLCSALRNKYGASPAWELLKVHFVAFKDGDKEKFLVQEYPYLPADKQLGAIVRSRREERSTGYGSCRSAVATEEEPFLPDNEPFLLEIHDAVTSEYSVLLDALDHFFDLMQPTITETVIDIAHNALTCMKTAAYTWFSGCHIPLLWRTQYADEPHAKKLARQQMVAGLVIEGNGCLVKDVESKVKDEIAKPGKFPRVYVSYGAGLLCAPTLPVVFKERLNGWHYFQIGSIQVCIIVYAKPKSSELIKLFEALIRARSLIGDHLTVAIYSDDSCYSGIVDNVPFGYNVDISSCDASNGPPMFYLVASLMAKIDANFAYLLLEQCCKPMKVEHPTDKQESFSLILPTAFEGSGTVLTTCLNHVASILIALSTAIKLSHAHGNIGASSDIERAIVAGAAFVGHKVTVASIEVNGVLCNSRFQFLKISPMVGVHTVTGEHRLLPVRNIGSIIKGFGQLYEDMQGYQIGVDNATFTTMTYNQRMNAYLGAVIKGYKNEPSSPILTSLRTRFTDTQGTLVDKFKLVEEDIDFSEYRVDDKDLYDRYGVDDYQATLFSLEDLRLGDNLQADPVLVRIMAVDYEYSSAPTDDDFSI